MNEKSPTKDADAGCVVVPKQVHAKAASASFNGLREGIMVDRQPLLVGPVTQHNGQGRTQSEHYADVASQPVVVGVDWFHVAGLAAVAEGHISEEGLGRVMAALFPEVQR